MSDRLSVASKRSVDFSAVVDRGAQVCLPVSRSWVWAVPLRREWWHPQNAWSLLGSLLLYPYAVGVPLRTRWEPAVQAWNTGALQGEVLLGNPKHERIGSEYQEVQQGLSVLEKFGADVQVTLMSMGDRITRILEAMT